MIRTFIASIQENSHKLLASITGTGIAGNIASQFSIINDVLGAIAALVAIFTGLLYLSWKIRDRRNENKRL